MGEMRIFNIDDELRRIFKIICVQRGVSMNTALIDLIRREVEQAGIEVVAKNEKPR